MPQSSSPPTGPVRPTIPPPPPPPHPTWIDWAHFLDDTTRVHGPPASLVATHGHTCQFRALLCGDNGERPPPPRPAPPRSGALALRLLRHRRGLRVLQWVLWTILSRPDRSRSRDSADCLPAVRAFPFSVGLVSQRRGATTRCRWAAWRSSPNPSFAVSLPPSRSPPPQVIHRPIYHQHINSLRLDWELRRRVFVNCVVE